MKTLIFISIWASIFIQQTQHLVGKYKMEYEEEFSSQKCTVEFKDNIYKRTLSNGKIVKGTIIYKNFVVSLVDHKTNLQVEFVKEEIQNDTIFFATKHLNGKSNDDMLIYSGKLIKVK